jgi:hypothetical protein
MNSTGAIAKKVQEVFLESFQDVYFRQVSTTKSNNNSIFVMITGYDIANNKIVGVGQFVGNLEELLLKMSTKSQELYLIGIIDILKDENNFVYQFNFEIPISPTLYNTANTRVTTITEEINNG